MTPTELEDRLRGDLRARQAEAPPAPVDLADRIRRRHRAQRRAQLLTAVAAVAVVAVFAGAATTVTRLRSDNDTTDRPSVGPGILGWPTRGSLAGDQAWLDGVRQLDWDVPAEPSGEVAAPPVSDRHVAYAGRVPDGQPNGQVALVVGEADGQAVAAWFTGYPGATPEEMELAASPQPVDATAPLAYVGPAGPTTDAIARVVVAGPDTTLEISAAPVVDADGTETTQYLGLPTTDGTFADVVDPFLAQTSEFRSRESAAEPYRTVPTVVALEDTRPTDPAAAPAVREDQLVDEAVRELLVTYALSEGQAAATVLASGTAANGDGVTLFGLTFPSGATGVWLLRYADVGEGWATALSRLPHAPAGTRLEDRLVAVPLRRDELVVRAPASTVRAEVRDQDGNVLGTVDLSGGVFVGEVPGAAFAPSARGAASVRALDASGRTVAEAEIGKVVAE